MIFLKFHNMFSAEEDLIHQAVNDALLTLAGSIIRRYSFQNFILKGARIIVCIFTAKTEP